MNKNLQPANLLDLAVQIQQIPAPTFSEGVRAEFVRGLFVNEGLQDVSIDVHGNVYARLPGPGKHKNAKPLIVSAHLDTVFPPVSTCRLGGMRGKSSPRALAIIRWESRHCSGSYGRCVRERSS